MKRTLHMLTAAAALLAASSLCYSAPPSASSNDYNAMVKSLVAAHEVKVKALLEERGQIISGQPGNLTPEQRTQALQKMRQQLQNNSARRERENKQFHNALNAAYRQYLKTHVQFPETVGTKTSS